MRQRLCRSCRQWHDTEEWPMECISIPSARSDAIPVPNFISDTMEPTEHPLNGVRYTSKAAFRAETRARGYEEVGNDPARNRPRPKPKADKAAIKTSVEKAIARFKSGERVTQ